MYGGVELLDSFHECLRIDTFELGRQLFDRVRGDLGDLADAVFVAELVDDFLIEDLPGELVRLLQHFAAVFGIGVIAEVGALVDEALAIGIDDDAERIAVLLEIVADFEVTIGRRIEIPADCVMSVKWPSSFRSR